MGFPVAQLVKNLLAMQEMQEMWVQSLAWEDPLEEEMATYSSILAWKIPMDRGAWQTTVCGVAKIKFFIDSHHNVKRKDKYQTHRINVGNTVFKEHKNTNSKRYVHFFFFNFILFLNFTKLY